MEIMRMNKLYIIAYLNVLVELWNIANENKREKIEYYIRKMDNSINYSKILSLFYKQFYYDEKIKKYINFHSGSM